MVPELKRLVLNTSLKSVSFHMAQPLTGHGCFQRYLFDRKLAVDPRCVQYRAPDDTVEYTLFECSHWDRDRRNAELAVSHWLQPGDVKRNRSPSEDGELTGGP